MTIVARLADGSTKIVASFNTEIPIESQLKAERARQGDAVALHNESALGKVERVLDKVTTAAGDATRRLADYSVNEKKNPLLRAGAAVLGAITSLGDEQTIGKTALVVAVGGVALLAAPAIAAALTPEAAVAGGGAATAAASPPGQRVVAAVNSAATAGQRIVGELLTGCTRHGIDSAISHDEVGVAPKAILETLRNPINVISQANDTVRYIGANAVVVLNRSGQLVTTWALNSGSARTP